ncbi:N-acylsphingosine amidohydrolase [Aureococcus anophagefferens]|uniref:N-acylsphingosine amidohydrolase n=1 Tax=Aureococcus anophagefferens TaxID=44056 RepID=A0ABR1G682_AURAN
MAPGPLSLQNIQNHNAVLQTKHNAKHFVKTSTKANAEGGYYHDDKENVAPPSVDAIVSNRPRGRRSGATTRGLRRRRAEMPPPPAAARAAAARGSPAPRPRRAIAPPRGRRGRGLRARRAAVPRDPAKPRPPPRAAVVGAAIVARAVAAGGQYRRGYREGVKDGLKWRQDLGVDQARALYAPAPPPPATPILFF